MSTPDGRVSLNYPNQQNKAIASIGVDYYHLSCYWHLSRRWHNLPTPTQAHLNLGEIVWCPSGPEIKGSVEIASLTEPDFECEDWHPTRPAVETIMEDGWTRYFIHTQTHPFLPLFTQLQLL